MAWKWNPFTNNLDYYQVSSGGGGSAFTLSHVVNFSALPDPTTVGLYDIFIVDNSQGNRFWYGSIGGTYYPAGAYYSDLTKWIYSESASKATQAEVNTGTNTEKYVTPETLKNSTQWSTKADLVGGTVPSSQLPSYVDDVIEGYYSIGIFYSDAGLTTPIVPTTGKIYVDLLQNKSYRWSGSIYIQISNAISSIDELTDVTIASVTNGQILQYNLTTSQWENKTITLGNGDMQKSTYDIDNDGIVDYSETIAITARNTSVTDILRKGTIVYLSGSTGNRPNAYKARANAESTSAGTFGVVVSDIGTNSDGLVAALGTLHDLDTRSTAPYPFTVDTLLDGDALWLDPNNAGYVTKTKPQAPNHIVSIGIVARTTPNLGRIIYRISNGFELDELHNVFINGTLANNDILYYDSATLLWKARSITTTLGYTPVPDTRTVNGYALSSNIALNKSDIGLPNVADVDTRNPANIVQTATYRFVTDTEKATWNGKQDALGYTPANKAGDTFTGAISATNLSGTNTGDQDISGLVVKNAAITGATKTKITYDSKGLVTSGTDATTADIADSTDKRYVTDAEKTKIGFLSSVASDVQNQINNKINSNTAIVAGTGTKITYDAKGLILSSTSATTADITDTTNKRYTTDAQQTILGNTSNINSGDETTGTIKTKLGAATTALDGYLTAADWNTFYGKQASLGYTPVNKAGDTMSSYLILNADPVAALGAATKQYVDNISAGINFHSPAHAATTINLVANYTNGTGGVNAKLTSTTNGAIIVDNHTMVQYERLLVWQQSNAFENGVYDVTATGDSTHPFELTRSTDADNNPAGEIAYGDFLFVQKGDTYGGVGFIVNTAGTINIGSTNISYVQFNAAQIVAAGYGLQELTPNVLSVDTSIIQTKLSAATSSVNGYLTSTDWDIFNGKQNALSGTGFVKISGTTISYDNATYITSSALSPYALTASPTFTGIPLSTTAAVDTNTTQIATTAYVIGQGYLKSSTADTTYQPLDYDLTAIAALTTNSFGLDILTKSDAASIRSYIGAGTGNGTGNGDALTTNPLSQFATTTSSQLAGVLSDETGTGSVVFSASPTLTGTPTAPTATPLTNTTQVATTEYVDLAVAAGGGGGGSTNYGLIYAISTGNYTL